MVEIILSVLFLIPAMLGLSELLHILKIRILSPKKPVISYNVIILNNDKPHQQLQHAIYQYLWHGRELGGVILAVNSFLNEENFSCCKELAEKNNIIFCSLDELYNLINIKM